MIRSLKIAVFVLAASVLGILIITFVISFFYGRNTTKASITEGKLNYFNSTLAECGEGLSHKQIIDCIEEHAASHGIERRNSVYFYTDSYGELFVVSPSKKCGNFRWKGPYSKGPNKVDECGKGDDIN